MCNDTVHVWIAVNNILSEYVRIHNNIFTQSFGEHVDYKEALNNLAIISKDLHDVSLTGCSYDVQLYLDAFRELIDQLIVVVSGLCGKEEGKRYSLLAYSRDVKMLKKLEKRHLELGQNLL